ncbi:MAG: STAS domain-containing protein [Deltaproteobacteria bacterium]|jgi:anti-sigma B factor antagonist|nr:STAS domain-containing protein [Deltaproteobacteria bacterium]
MKSSSAISVARVGSRTVLAPKRSLTYENREELQAIFDECVSQQRSDIILDCKAVGYMDSEALELVVRMHEELRSQGNRLKIIGLNEVCRDIFFATRLIHLQVYEDIHEAIRSER